MKMMNALGFPFPFIVGTNAPDPVSQAKFAFSNMLICRAACGSL